MTLQLYPVAAAFSVLDGDIRRLGGLVQAHGKFVSRLRKLTVLSGHTVGRGQHDGRLQTVMASTTRALCLRNVPREHEREQWLVLFSGVWRTDQVGAVIEMLVAWEDTEDVDQLLLGGQGDA